ncbi:MAG TPA: addiction module toxin, HicA family [Candidatus Hydrogenedentes bacterium]|nr:addiction module toxin, HicA family [Candidatus Hydrogenedentota bacterium]
MKRVDLIRHLRGHGGVLFREGGNHSVYLNPVRKKVSAVPRHREVFNAIVFKICRDLDIPPPHL